MTTFLALLFMALVAAALLFLALIKSSVGAESAACFATALYVALCCLVTAIKTSNRRLDE